MSGQANRYDWAAYYVAAYEKERKNNIVLAGKIADAERKQTDLSENLECITTSIFWKMTGPFRGLYHRIKGKTGHSRKQGGSADADLDFAHYAKEVMRQKHPYLEWIREKDKDDHEKIMDPITVNGWQSIPVPGSDIMLLVYGKGLLCANIYENIKSYFNNNKRCKIAYGDEDFYWGDLSHRMQPWFKPCYSPDTLLAFNYWGHLVAVKADLLSAVLSGGGIMSAAMRTSQSVRFYDLCLCLEEEAFRRCRLDGTPLQEGIRHMPGILYHKVYEPSVKYGQRIEEAGTQEERADLAEQCLIEELEAGRFLTGAGPEYVSVRMEAFRRRGVRGSLINGQEPDLYHVIYDTSISGRERCARAKSADRHVAPNHFVSVIIPSKDHPEALRKCFESFRQKTDYPYYEWIVVDNGSNAKNRDEIEALRQEYGFTYLYEEMPFNFSKMCNMGAAKAGSDLLLFMNDDVEVIEKSWLRRMAGQALQPHTGAVGAKLWYADTLKIQHAGITNMKIGPSHKLVTFPDDRDYYYGRNRVVYNMVGVTAACLMVRREKYEEVGGFDETMAVSYNDVDFCFKLAEAGYYNVQRNDAVLYHHESLSRGLDEQDKDKWERLLHEKERLYIKHPQMKGKDPFYNEELIDNASHYGCNYQFPYEEHLRTVQVHPVLKEFTRRIHTNGLKLTVDRAETQHKIHADEPDILWVMGWCYVPGADNAAYEKHVLLKCVEGEDYSAEPFLWHRRDVEEILPGEQNIGLAGFVLRVLKKDLPSGTYRIGMLCINRSNGDKQVAWSDKTCEI